MIFDEDLPTRIQERVISLKNLQQTIMKRLIEISFVLKGNQTLLITDIKLILVAVCVLISWYSKAWRCVKKEEKWTDYRASGKPLKKSVDVRKSFTDSQFTRTYCSHVYWPVILIYAHFILCAPKSYHIILLNNIIFSHSRTILNMWSSIQVFVQWS